MDLLVQKRPPGYTPGASGGTRVAETEGIDRRLVHLLDRVGLSSAAIDRLAPRVVAPPPGTFEPDELDAATDERLALLTAIVAATETRHNAHELHALLGAAQGREQGLPLYDAGRFWHIKGVVAWRIDGSLYAAMAALDRSLRLLRAAPEQNAEWYQARVHDTLGQLLQAQGLLADARYEFEQALERREASEDLPGAALTLGNLGRLCMELGEFEAAEGYLLRDLEIVERTTPEWTRVRTQLLSHLGSCALECGRLAEARERFRASRRLATGDDDRGALALAALGLGRVDLAEQRVVDAHGELDLARRHAEVAVLPDRARQVLDGLVLQFSAELNLAAGSADAALEDFEAARPLLTEASGVSRVEVARLLHGFARATLATGREGRAAALLRDALHCLDATALDSLRRKVEVELRQQSREYWLLHSAGRFIGQHRIELLLREAGRGGFRGTEERVAILFSDVRGFTSLSEQLDAEELVVLLNDYLTRMTRCIEHFGGMVDKFIGDAVMAVFCLPEPRPDQAERAALAALMMRSELERLNRRIGENGIQLAAGIGLHFGRVVAGLIGSPQKRSYTVIGDSVNTASRVEGMTKQLGAPILVTDEVVAQWPSPERFVLCPLGRYRVKGREKPVAAFELLGERDASPPEPGDCQEAERVAAALELFYDRAFEAAAARFEELAAGGAARARGYRLLARSARALAAEPPPPTWQGETTLLKK